jgi:hypothetical protein
MPYPNSPLEGALLRAAEKRGDGLTSVPEDINVRKALLIGAIVAILQAAVGASAAVRLIKLPNGDYTVPMSELEGSGAIGQVTMHPQGLKTIVTVQVSGKANHRHVFSLHAGSDCTIFGAPNSIALAPAQTGQPSRTIVALPIGNLMSKDYVLAARDATARAQFQEACAHL